MVRRQCGESFVPAVEESVGDDDQSTGTPLRKSCESPLDFGFVVSMEDFDLNRSGGRCCQFQGNLSKCAIEV